MVHARRPVADKGGRQKEVQDKQDQGGCRGEPKIAQVRRSDLLARLTEVGLQACERESEYVVRNFHESISLGNESRNGQGHLHSIPQASEPSSENVSTFHTTSLHECYIFKIRSVLSRKDWSGTL